MKSAKFATWIYLAHCSAHNAVEKIKWKQREKKTDVRGMGT